MRTVSKVNISLGLILITLLVTALLTFYQRSVRVTVFDPRIRVLSVKILRGTNDDFYAGDQLERRGREFLRQSMQLKVAPLQNLGRLALTQNDTYRLAILYRWESAEAPPRNVIAELVDNSGRTKQLLGAFAGRNPYCYIWELEDLPQNSATYRLRLRAAELEGNVIPIPGPSPAWIQVRPAKLATNTQPILGFNQAGVELPVLLRARAAELRKNMQPFFVSNLVEVEIRKLPPFLPKP